MDKKRVKNFYEKYPLGGIWDSFERKLSWRLGREPWVLDLTNEAAGKTLEVGCGTGEDSSLLARNPNVTSLTSIDLTERHITEAKRNFKQSGLKGNFIRMDAENLKFKDSTFDTVYSYGVLHHTPDTQGAIDEIYRVLKPNGKFILMLYHKQGLYGFAIRTIRPILAKLPLKFKTPHNSRMGTLIIEFAQHPVLKTYNNEEIKELLHKFRIEKMYFTRRKFYANITARKPI